jgi:two-component system, NarL family, sensor histidine kinase UhpB
MEVQATAIDLWSGAPVGEQRGHHNPSPPLPARLVDMGSRRGMYARVFAVNAAILTAAVAILIFTPVTVSRHVTHRELVVLLFGLALMLIANAALLRWSLRPLHRLRDLMFSVDMLEPGARLDPSGPAEVASVIQTFNATIDRLENERRMTMRRVLSAQEAERRRVAQELHDQIGQNLTAVVLELKRVLEQSPEHADALSDAQELARESLNDLSRISSQLRPPVLDDLGLGSALTSLADGMSKRSGVEISSSVAEGDLGLEPEVELALFRVAQEAVTNAVRHAQCHSVELVLRHDADATILRVADDGIGLRGKAPGAGLRGMRERAVTIGATFDAYTRAKGGTVVTLRLPRDAG